MMMMKIEDTGGDDDVDDYQGLVKIGWQWLAP